MRERLPGEIIPVSTEHSNTADDNTMKYAAVRSIDLDLQTWSWTSSGAEGTWLRVNLNEVHCVQRVQWHPYRTWSCTDSACSGCEGDRYCDSYSLSVNISDRTAINYILHPISDCKYGDTVKLQRNEADSSIFFVFEIIIIGKEGERKHKK